MFSLEPLVARRILPWFGGSAAVWSTCLVFYQVALLAGYFYARTVVRHCSPRMQGCVHLALLAGALLLLPVGPGAGWKSAAPAHPAFLIFGMLTATVALPFIALSASTPLLQAWLARNYETVPYWLFALSNLASLAALLAYPVVVEPWLGTREQSRAWSALFGVFAVCAGWLALREIRSPERNAPVRNSQPGLPARNVFVWLALSACGSMLLLSITNHLDENVAAVPLLWVLPLAVYLLSFVYTFGSRPLYRRQLWLRLLAFAIGVLAYAIFDINSALALAVSVPVFLGALFIICVFCHGELHRARPAPDYLTEFYLAIAAGSACGAIAIGLAAPSLLSGIYELPLAVIATASLALWLTWREGGWPMRLLWITGGLLMTVVAGMNFAAYHRDALSLRRSFYGSLRVVQTPRAGTTQQRILFHGTIEHGSQFVQSPGRQHATTYYGPDSGIGIVLREAFDHPKRVGIVGLGAGTLAAYGKKGDEFRFYELNSQVVDIAQNLFFYLRETPAGTKIVNGDGRLSLESERTQFDVLVLDAFSGDAIPVHLLTREAMTIYRAHLRPRGVIAFHVSNDYLDLAPVVQQLALNSGYGSILVHNHANPEDATLPADWMLVTNNPEVLSNPAVRLHSQTITAHPDNRMWTDDYSGIWQVFRTPKLQ